MKFFSKFIYFLPLLLFPSEGYCSDEEIRSEESRRGGDAAEKTARRSRAFDERMRRETNSDPFRLPPQAAPAPRRPPDPLCAPNMFHPEYVRMLTSTGGHSQRRAEQRRKRRAEEAQSVSQPEDNTDAEEILQESSIQEVITARRSRDAEAKRVRRAEEAEEEVAARRAQDAQAKILTRAGETEEEAAGRRAMETEAIRLRRAGETEEKTAERRVRDVDAQRVRRDRETEEETATRRLTVANTIQANRQSLSDSHALFSQTAAERAAENENRRNRRTTNAAYVGRGGQTASQEHYLGGMDQNCSHCGAKFFEGEFPRQADGTYSPAEIAPSLLKCFETTHNFFMIYLPAITRLQEIFWRIRDNSILRLP